MSRAGPSDVLVAALNKRSREEMATVEKLSERCERLETALLWSMSRQCGMLMPEARMGALADLLDISYEEMDRRLGR